jgi:hypothetical protein
MTTHGTAPEKLLVAARKRVLHRPEPEMLLAPGREMGPHGYEPAPSTLSVTPLHPMAA